MATTQDSSAGDRAEPDPGANGPAAMDRFHTRLVKALGTAWILDGLEITLASAVAAVLTQPDTLHLSSGAVGAIATVRTTRWHRGMPGGRR